MTVDELPSTLDARLPAPHVWDTVDVQQREAFDYYRDAICRSFMPLRPEMAAQERCSFNSRVTSYALNETTLNQVLAKSHEVHRGRSEISASPEACLYLNYQMRGCCTIDQGGKSIELNPGEVGIFSSDRNFELNHSKRPNLVVASLMIPKTVFGHLDQSKLVVPHKLSAHRLFGKPLAEAFHSANANIDTMGENEAHAIKDVIVHLAGLVLQEDSDAARHDPIGLLHQIHSIIRSNCRRVEFTLEDCARQAGVSARHVQKMFAQENDSYSAYLWRTRVALARQELANPLLARLTAQEIGYQCGFSDPSHFSRSIKARYGLSPRQLRSTIEKT